MATDKEYFEFAADSLSHIDGVSYRKMMGEYIIYYNEKVIGGIYDNRLLVKIIPSAKRLMPEAREELPYEGAKSMLLVEEIENRDFTKRLFEEMYSELPTSKKRKK